MQFFLSKHHILSNSQYGFSPGHSTELAIIDTIEKLTKATIKKETSIGVFLDLSKAFDTIDHRILLQKLLMYGFHGIAYDWIKSYLTNRKQFTSFKNENSYLQTIKCGVLKGSILGPLLFIIYVNDITMVSSNSSLVMFADDTNIFFNDSDTQCLERTVCHELALYFDWFASNKLSLNISKTNYMVFNLPSTQNHDFKLTINNIPLKPASSVNFLGVYIDSKLNWNNHME